MAGAPLRQLFWRPARLLADPGEVVAGGRGVRPHAVDSGPLGSAGSRTRRAALIGCASAIATVLTMILVGASGGSGV